ncbi:MAG: class I SAM-dependent DNA methyltransferase, partial [Prevotella sp.]|nr:class I SAM-dependent DNA methyltransferase [Prevotella sp.]
MNKEKQQSIAASEFAKRWMGRGYEKGDSQIFWADLLTNVYGVKNIAEFIFYEEQVKVDKTNFIDGHIPSTKVLIEQKTLGKDLRKGIVQSDGSILNPFQQAKRYVANMPLSKHPRWIVTCNFSEFLVYDMEQPNGEPEQILLENLGKEYYRLQFLVDAKNEHLSKEMQVSMQAGEIVGRIYEALLKQYDDNSPEALRWLNILCVRIVFCLYAEDAGVFGHDQFHDYLVHYESEDLRNALIRLFEVLNKPLDKRSKYLKDDLKAFPYTNGGLFEEEIEIPQFTEELKQALLQNASLDFDWSEISPTIFGAVFESTLNPETRRSGGMHYTSIENIHKVIDPLFLNDLRRELDDILEEKVEKQRQKKLDAYQNRLASLTFLDPACGSGNFLTETYLSLRRLENEAIRERYHGQAFIGFEEVNPIKVSIQQFYGIEINDFAVTVATTALWISEAQMLAETEKIIHRDIDFLPLKSYTNIKEGNALRVSWNEWDVYESNPTIITEEAYVYPKQKDESTMVSEPIHSYERIDLYADKVVTSTKPKESITRHVDFDYIIGNPPFVG